MFKVGEWLGKASEPAGNASAVEEQFGWKNEEIQEENGPEWGLQESVLGDGADIETSFEQTL